MGRSALARGVVAGVLVAVTGVLAWILGRPLIFPSLGPTAYVAATASDDRPLGARAVLGGHLVGVLAGLGAYHLLADGSVMTAAVPRFSEPYVRLAASGVLAVSLTGWGMIATDTSHPPAAATTLIVALGLLARPVDGIHIMLAVVVLYLAHRTLWRLRHDLA
jgi:hypothetical protein